MPIRHAALALLAATALATATPAQALVLNEVMARNAATRTDQDGDFSDWIEIHNPGAAAIPLGGLFLTDDPAQPTKWQFPATLLPAGGYVIVFASRKDRAVSGRELHTNFKLGGQGEYLALVSPNGSTVVDEYAPLPPQRTGFSFGRSGAGTAYFATPTPGTANGPGLPGFVGPTTIQAARGFHTVAFPVTMTCATPGATIRYTTDGRPPTATTGAVYAGPIRITRTTVLRAAGFAAGLGPSEDDTRTFLFVDDIVRQPDAPPGFPGSWGGAPAADYGVDPEIAQSTAYRQALRDGLQALPVLSVSLPVDALFGSSGIYSNTTRSGRAWEREAAVEYLDPSSNREFSLHAGLRIQGGASRNPGNSPKHSLSLRFRDAYQGQLAFDLFDGSRVTDFDSLQLRANYNNSWIHWDSNQRRRGLMIRDQWMRDSLIAMGQADGGQGRYVHLFLNGLYWGVYNLHERAEASHYAEWNGGREQDYDARNGSAFSDGSSASWNAMRAAVVNRNWPLIQQRLDVDSYIDWIIANRFGGNQDLKVGGNWRAAGGGPGNAPWRFYSWDAERTLESPTQNGTRPSADPPDLLSYLDDIPDFVVRFGDAVHRHFFHDGPLTATRTATRLARRRAELDPAIVAESARWGDYRRDVHSSRVGPYELYERNLHWAPEANQLLSNYFPVRTARVLSQFRSQGLYPSTAAPTFGQHGGKVAAGYRLSMTAPRGQILYTVDGVDPRAPGGGSSTSTKVYIGPIPIPASTTVRARVYDSGSWSALNEARFLVESISINELLAKNTTGIRDNAGDLEDWIELYNSNTVPVPVGGMYLTDTPSNPTKWQIPQGQVLAAGGTLIIWADDEPTEGPLHATFKLTTAGEDLLLFDIDGKTLLDQVTFGVQVPDVSTGRLHDGMPQLVTFPEPSPGQPNSIPVCGSRRYSALDPTTQVLDLNLAGQPRLGQLVQFQSRGGPAGGVHVLILGVLADDLPFGASASRILVATPLFVLRSAPASATGAADLPLQIPNLPVLVGESAYFQTWAQAAGPWVGSVGLELKFCR